MLTLIKEMTLPIRNTVIIINKTKTMADLVFVKRFGKYLRLSIASSPITPNITG
jgi:hypothetical protein